MPIRGGELRGLSVMVDLMRANVHIKLSNLLVLQQFLNLRVKITDYRILSLCLFFFLGGKSSYILNGVVIGNNGI